MFAAKMINCEKILCESLSLLNKRKIMKEYGITEEEWKAVLLTLN